MIEGGVYSIDNGDGTFGVVKVLKLEPGVVHIRVYRNKYAARPTSVELSDLSLGGFDDPGGFGVGHLPISANNVAGWRPVLLAETQVAEDELEGYRLWKESGGGVFGG
ncbi:MAG TPA: hypothetical protein VGF55_04270 [Gemmataceae bacterium]|jgi:hypothetical protein